MLSLAACIRYVVGDAVLDIRPKLPVCLGNALAVVGDASLPLVVAGRAGFWSLPIYIPASASALGIGALGGDAFVPTSFVVGDCRAEEFVRLCRVFIPVWSALRLSLYSATLISTLYLYSIKNICY